MQPLVSRSHNLTVQSCEAENTVRDAESTFTALTQSVCPRNRNVDLSSKFHTLTVLSTEPETRMVESKCRQITPPMCPVSVDLHSPVLQFQTFKVRSTLTGHMG